MKKRTITEKELRQAFGKKSCRSPLADKVVAVLFQGTSQDEAELTMKIKIQKRIGAWRIQQRKALKNGKK